ncbi:pilus assembly protein PilM [uncultured Tyzzerella sp.]|uniref:pilus assembly protein PilM n=1 Tax=uncultured Tyzzerella sp. TaxID=2321398 RepID=UPI0029421D53|nr:pilus assembly protein PilM [uncultured Tyzzerella sp.]
MPVSIDICDSCIKVIEGEQQGSKIKINKAFIKEIDKSYIHNGYIHNKIDLTLLLTDIVNEYGLKNKDCFISFNSTDTVYKEITLPKTKYSNLDKLIKNSIQELFGDAINLVMDYEVCNEIKEDDKIFYKILIYGVPLKIVEDYKNVISNCGLVPKSLDIKRNAIYKISNNSINGEDIKDDINLFIDITGNDMMLSLMSKKIVLYKRDVDISEDIKREEIFLQGNSQEVNKEDEYELLEEIAISDIKKDDDITFLDDQDHHQEEAIFISPILLRVYEEVHKITQFSMSLNNGDIQKIYLYGDREDLDEIADYISNNTNTSSEKIKEIANIKSNVDIDISKFFIAIGNLLRK